ncbi:rab-GTPase-TBC domain-containing protein [Lipomyces kononenkoae]
MTSVYGAGAGLRQQQQEQEQEQEQHATVERSEFHAKQVPDTVESSEFLDSPYSIFRDILRPSSPPSPPSLSSTATPSSLSTVPDESSLPSAGSSQRNSTEAVVIPANLHTSSDAVVQALLDRYSVLGVVRQLARDLALREKEVSYLLRMHDEKMKALSDLLRQSGVGDDEIYERLRDVEIELSHESLDDVVAGSDESLVHQTGNSEIGSRNNDGTSETVDGLLSGSSQEDMHDNSAGVLGTISFRRAAFKTHNQQQDLLQPQAPQGPDSRTIRKTKSTFKLPFFWKSESEDDLTSAEIAKPDLMTASSQSLEYEQVASSSASTHSDPTARRNRRAFAVPLFEDEGSLPPVMSTFASKSSIRNNVNNYFKATTEVSVKGVTRRKQQQILAPEREDAEHEAPIANTAEGEDSDDTDEMDSSSSDGLASSRSFKSAVQFQYDVDSPRSMAGLVGRNLAPAEKMKTEDEVDDDDEEEYEIIDEKQPRNFRDSFESKLMILRNRLRSGSVASIYPGLSQSVPEWLPNSVKDGSSSSHQHTSSSSGHGPVELGDIVPQSMQPPTLLQSWNDHYRSEDTFLLTDRFGFIYDRQHRPVLPLVESSVGSRLLDLDSLDFLFDHADDMIAKPEPQASISDEKEESLFGQGLPIPSLRIPIGRMVNRPAFLGSRTPSTETETEPSEKDTLESVKSLLDQLTDLHDSLQRVQKSRWDEFLRKINADGSEDAPVAIEHGELFGVQGRILLQNKQSRFKEFKALVLGGIPVVYRSKIWSECCGADGLKVPGVYEELVHGEHDPEALSQIELDLYRTMPSNVFFGGKGPGVGKLRRVLVAFSKRNPKIGYCQGMNMIAATLLLTHATEEAAFWSFVALLENILPSGYFDPPLLTSRADQRVLKEYLKELQPKLYDHLVRTLGVDIEAITFNWFLSVFTDCLTAEILFRVWDVFMCVEGEVYLFRVALALFRISTKNLMQLSSAAEVYSYMKDMASHSIGIEGLIRLIDSLRQQVRVEDVVARRKKVINVMHREMGF